MRYKKLSNHRSTKLVNAGGRNQTPISDFKHNAFLHCALKVPRTNSIMSVHKTDELVVSHIWFNKWAKPFHNLLISVADKSSFLILCQHKYLLRWTNKPVGIKFPKG